MSLNSRLLDPPPYGSPAWLLWRRGGLGASDLGSLAGFNPWRSEYELCLLKRGLVDGDEQSWPMAMGHLTEPVALDWHERTFGRELVRGETWTDARWPHCWATLDARVKDDRVGVEAKWSTGDWSGVPRHVYVQVQAQMALADLKSVDIVLITPRKAPHVFATVERDETDAIGTCDMAEEWWARYMTGDEMPPPDGSREGRRYLDTLRGDEAAQATEEQAALMAALRVVRNRMAEAERDEGRIVATLKASMAGVGSLAGDGFRVSWQAVKPRITTDWRAVAAGCADVVPEEDYAQLVAFHTSVGEGTTRFVPKWDEEETA